jgi:hypothetical protein
MEPNSIVIVYLQDPREKIWGVLKGFNASGFTVTGLPLSSFDDWMADVASGGMPTMSLSTMFFPLHRLEKILLDEAVGAAPSLRQQFQERVHMSVEEYLGLPRP